jgi:hypothetical protein
MICYLHLNEESTPSNEQSKHHKIEALLYCHWSRGSILLDPVSCSWVQIILIFYVASFRFRFASMTKRLELSTDVSRFTMAIQHLLGEKIANSYLHSQHATRAVPRTLQTLNIKTSNITSNIFIVTTRRSPVASPASLTSSCVPSL